MPKDSAKSRVRVKLKVKDQGKNSKRLQELNDGEPSQKFKRNYLLTPFLLVLILAGFLILKSKDSPKTTSSTASRDTSPQSTQEAKLEDFYKEAKGVDLKNFVPRYSIYEDSGMGFKVGYPVDFTPTSQSYGLRLTPTNNIGSIDVYASQSSPQVKVNAGGLSSKELEALNSAADFIRSTYQSVTPTTYNQSTLKQRFSNGSGSSHY